MTSEPIILERVLQAPVSKVWKAITDARQMQSWYFEIKTFKAEPGYEFEFNAGHPDQKWVHRCKVQEVIKEKKLSYTWKYDEFPDVETLVTFELFDQGDNTTRLRLTHEGVNRFPQTDKNFRRGSFVEGWHAIVGVSLKDYTENFFVEITLNLAASLSKVWDVLTNTDLVNQWANAFSEGTYVETDWKLGSTVEWKAADHTAGAKGVIVMNEPRHLLRTAYFDDVNMAPPAQPGKYAETYLLFEQDGKTRLLISAGPLEKAHYDMHVPKWNEAVKTIKNLAEH